jgi:hypothetical protein
MENQNGLCPTAPDPTQCEDCIQLCGPHAFSVAARMSQHGWTIRKDTGSCTAYNHPGGTVYYQSVVLDKDES